MQFETDFPFVDALQGVPRTSLVPLVARAQAGASYPALDPQDRCAKDLLTALGAQAHISAQEAATLVNVCGARATSNSWGKPSLYVTQSARD